MFESEDYTFEKADTNLYQTVPQAMVAHIPRFFLLFHALTKLCL